MQNENKEKKKIQNLIKVNKSVRIVVTVLACLIVVGVSYTVYSKYYKTGFNKGMSIASGFYFNSNYMASVDELRGMTDEEMTKIPDDVMETIIRSSRSTSEIDGGYSFSVEVRNYDNQLLYNDKDLDVQYNVFFMLLEQPVNASYSVTLSKGGSNQTKQLEWENGQGKIARFENNTLQGGTPRADIYRLNIKPDDGQAYEASDVLMIAYPVGPDYLQGTKAIAGIVRADYVEKPFEIDEDESGFVICKDSGYDEEHWKERVLQESGYEYRVYTSGNYSGSGAVTRKTIRVKWRTDMYQINNFDTYYQEAAKDSTRLTTEMIDGNEYQVMSIDVLPYAFLKFTFFRADGFENVINSTADKEVFERSVFAEVADEDSSGTP